MRQTAVLAGNRGIMGFIRRTILMLTAMAGLAALPQEAFAVLPQGGMSASDYPLLVCNKDGSVKDNTELYDDQIPKAWKTKPDGRKDCTGDCPHDAIRHIFSNVLFDFLGVLNAVLGKLYCGIQHDLVDVLRLLMTVYVAVFGWQLFMGTAQLNTRDVMMRLIKITLVWVFATKSTAGINLLFRGAVAFINDVSFWVLKVIPGMDTIDVGQGDCVVSEFKSDDHQLPIFGFFDCIIYYAFTGAAQESSVKLIGFFGAMVLAYPPISGMAYFWAVKTFVVMARAVINLLMALASIAFLVSLTPIFFSFALFQVTSHFFENWLRYLISYIIQIIMVFVVIVMWILVFFQFTYFFDDLSNLVFESNPVMQAGMQIKPGQSWGICPTTYSEVDLPGQGATAPNLRKKVPLEECSDPHFNPVQEPGNANWKTDAEKVRPPTTILKDSKFLYYVFYHLIGLIVVTYCFGQLLEQVPSIASSISGPAPLPQILGGFGMKNFGSAGGLAQNVDNIKGAVGSVSRNAASAAAGTTGTR